MADKVSLFVNGKIFDGWKDVEVKRSIKAISGSFSLSITDKWSGQNIPWEIKPGDSCEVKLAKDTVITGFVDSVSLSAEPGGRSISVSGRDKTCDLVDCSVVHATGEFRGITLKRLAETLVLPFGLSVIFNRNVGPAFERIAISQGDTVFETLEKAARKRGFLITTDSLGSVVFTQPGQILSTTRLDMGQNIISGSGNFDIKNRYSEYTVKGQHYTSGATETNPSFAYSIKSISKDETVKRHRPLVIQSEQYVNNSDAITRANWEATVRAAKASTFNITVQGWRQGDGTLWQANQLVLCKADWIGLNGELLITDVTHRLSSGSGSDGGSTTTLVLERKDAYIPEPTIPEKRDPLIQAINKDPGLKRAPL